MNAIWLSVGLIAGAVVMVSAICHVIDYFDARRARKRRWSDQEHRLLSMSIKLVK